jgi:hypothetical protein
MSYYRDYQNAIYRVSEAIKNIHGCLPPESDHHGTFIDGVINALNDALSPDELALLRYAIRPADANTDPFETFGIEEKADDQDNDRLAALYGYDPAYGYHPD